MSFGYVVVATNESIKGRGLSVMRKTISAWAVFSPHSGLLWFTVQPTKRATLERFRLNWGGSADLKDRPGYSIKRITITIED